MPVQAFQCELQAKQLPPSLQWLETEIHSQLADESQLLQWAIVKANPETGQLWIEGSVV